MESEKEIAYKIAEELKPLLEETKKTWIKEAVAETLLRIGIDATKPIELQEDFSFLRKSRIGAEDIKKRAVMKMVDYGVVGLVCYFIAMWKRI